jgi:hypothetical protein
MKYSCVRLLCVIHKDSLLLTDGSAIVKRFFFGFAVKTFRDATVTHSAEYSQRLGREDHRLKAYHVTVSYRGIFDILYVFTVCNQHEISDASNKQQKT